MAIITWKAIRSGMIMKPYLISWDSGVIFVINENASILEMFSSYQPFSLSNQQLKNVLTSWIALFIVFV